MDFPDSKEILHNITKIIWDMHCHFFLCSSLTLFHFIPWVRISIRNVDSLPCGGHIACDANIDWEPTLTSSWPTGAGLVIGGWGGQHGGQVNFLRGQVTLVQLIHPTERGLGPVMDWKIIKLKFAAEDVIGKEIFHVVQLIGVRQIYAAAASTYFLLRQTKYRC